MSMLNRSAAFLVFQSVLVAQAFAMASPPGCPSNQTCPGNAFYVGSEGTIQTPWSNTITSCGNNVDGNTYFPGNNVSVVETGGTYNATPISASGSCLTYKVISPGAFTVYATGTVAISGVRYDGTWQFSGSWLTTDGTDQVYVRPKYLVVGVTYAPPGGSSYVQYTTGSTSVVTNSVNNSFSSAVNVSTTADIEAGIPGFNDDLTITGNYGYSSQSVSGNTNSMTRSFLNSIKTLGVGNSYIPINHDDDLIWLWLNPVALFNVSTQSNGSLIDPTAPITWAGYAFDASDTNNNFDVFPVAVGDLNGHYTPSPSTLAELNRAWASNQNWVGGATAALTQQDYANILVADPFAAAIGTPPTTLSSSYVVSRNPGASSTNDGRYTLAVANVDGTDTSSFPYVQAEPGQTAGPTDTYTVSNTSTTATNNGTTYTNSTGFSIEDKANAGGILFGFTSDLKVSDTFTWTTQNSSSNSTASSTSSSVQIVGPPCSGGSTSSCTPAYAGYGLFNVYTDSVWGTFMFSPF